MSPEKAHELAGEYGLELRFDHSSDSWSLSPPGQSGSDQGVWIASNALRGLSPNDFVRHYVKEVLGRIAGSNATGED
jgi:hypothetical protein